MKLYGDDLKEGDVLMTNSPHAGGSQVLSIFSSVLLILIFIDVVIFRTSP